MQHQISETLQAVISQAQVQRLQNYEMEKILKLNEDLISDETNPDLLELMKRITEDLNDTLQKFKAIAKAKGIRYNITAKKEPAEAKVGSITSREHASTNFNKTQSNLEDGFNADSVRLGTNEGGHTIKGSNSEHPIQSMKHTIDSNDGKHSRLATEAIKIETTPSELAED